MDPGFHDAGYAIDRAVRGCIGAGLHWHTSINNNVSFNNGFSFATWSVLCGRIGGDTC